MNVSRFVRLAAVLTVFTAVLPMPASADPGVYQQVLRSTVWVVNKQEPGFGSGALVDLGNQLVVTNDHVVKGAKEVLIYFPAKDAEGNLVTDPKAYESDFAKLRAAGLASIGTVIARWAEKDLAVVQLEQLPPGSQALRLAPSSCPPGANVHSIGNAVDTGGLWVYTPGKVRNLYPIRTQRRNAYTLVTTSAINPGDSGGPMVNDQCELVGICCSAPIVGKLKKDSHGETVYDDHVRLVSYSIDVREVHTLLQRYPGYQPPVDVVAAMTSRLDPVPPHETP